ncbi:twin-arginine translocation signal domain-containing protein [Streptomyces sp. H27-H5]|uniref:twin-arginine translocation signal domain-containing protein n=1 Tax=Streptomyces sp. H27-H5 TaxID=2996460 RepID=UPI003B63D49E
MPSRRHFLAGSAAAVGLAALPRAAGRPAHRPAHRTRRRPRQPGQRRPGRQRQLRLRPHLLGPPPHHPGMTKPRSAAAGAAADRGVRPGRLRRRPTEPGPRRSGN